MKLFSFFNKQNKENVTIDMTVDSESSKKNSERASLTDILVTTWNTLNVDLLASYLTDDFQYNSVWVSSTMKGKEQYLAYLRGKFETFKKSGDAPIADVVDESGYTVTHLLIPVMTLIILLCLKPINLFNLNNS